MKRDSEIEDVCALSTNPGSSISGTKYERHVQVQAIRQQITRSLMHVYKKIQMNALTYYYHKVILFRIL